MKITRDLFRGILKEFLQEYEVETLPRPKTHPGKVKPAPAPEKTPSPKVRPSPFTPPKTAPKTNPKGMFEGEKNALTKISNRYMKIKGSKSRKPSLSELLLEVSVEELKKQWVDSGKMEQDVFDSIIDSITKVPYATWVISMVGKDLILPEDVYKFEEYFDVFDRHKPKFPIKDIGGIKTLENLREFQRIAVDLIELEKVDPSKRSGKPKEDKYQQFYIGTIEGYAVYELPKGRHDLYDTSCDIGAGTAWCTATGNTRRHFDKYIADGPLFIFYNYKTKDKFQIQYESSQFKDKRDLSAL